MTTLRTRAHSLLGVLPDVAPQLRALVLGWLCGFALVAYWQAMRLRAAHPPTSDPTSTPAAAAFERRDLNGAPLALELAHRSDAPPRSVHATSEPLRATRLPSARPGVADRDRPRAGGRGETRTKGTRSQRATRRAPGATRRVLAEGRAR